MNDLSWMLYWADAIPAVGSLCGLLGLGMLAARGLWFVRNAFLEDCADGRGVSIAPKWMAGTAISLLFVAAVLPGKETFYAIAASEMGEEALKSPIVTKAGKALESWLDKQLADETQGETE